MVCFDRVVVIFNPQRNGDAPKLAEELRAQLARRLPGLKVAMKPTESAGHGRLLAREAAHVGRPLIVSVSGDGGYNEVVDGVMQAGNTDVICAVMAAGNANDHRWTTRRRPLVEAIVAGDVHAIDLLRVTTRIGPSAHVRYAHSYIGLGLTPIVAIDLEKGEKGSLKEIGSVIRTFSRFRPFMIELDDGTRPCFDSLVFTNIAQMAKYATLSDDGRPDDGQFEVITLPHVARWRILGTALKAATRGLGPQPSTREYHFTTIKPLPIQIDGEVFHLDADAAVTIDIVPGALATIG